MTPTPLQNAEHVSLERLDQCWKVGKGCTLRSLFGLFHGENLTDQEINVNFCIQICATFMGNADFFKKCEFLHISSVSLCLVRWRGYNMDPWILFVT